MNSEQVRRLYDEHAPALLGYACALLGVRASAEDVLHAVFLALIDGNKPLANPVPYVYRAVRNAALNVRRQEARLIPLENEPAWFESANGISESALAVQEALIALPDLQREVVVLHIWCGMTFAEIADLAQIPPDTAASRYKYGLSKLGELLGPRGTR
jgi:RNA polymerase sigma-70 factor (ECF subfamily)